MPTASCNLRYSLPLQCYCAYQAKAMQVLSRWPPHGVENIPGSPCVQVPVNWCPNHQYLYHFAPSWQPGVLFWHTATCREWHCKALRGFPPWLPGKMRRMHLVAEKGVVRQKWRLKPEKGTLSTTCCLCYLSLQWSPSQRVESSHLPIWASSSVTETARKCFKDGNSFGQGDCSHWKNTVFLSFAF